MDGCSSTVAIRELIGEAMAGVWRRPMRSALTAGGVALGVAGVVATIGLALTASTQVSSSLDRLRATEVSVIDMRPELGSPFGGDLQKRLSILNGLLAGGEWWRAEDLSGGRVRALATGPVADFPVVAVGPGALEAMRPQMFAGGVFETWHHTAGAPVVLLGSVAATKLGIGRLDAPTAIWLMGRPLTVVGVIQDVERRPEILLGLVIPASLQLVGWSGGAHDTRQLLIETDLGAANLVGRQLPYALLPAETDRLFVTVPPDPVGLRESIQSELVSVLLALAAMSLVVGAGSIAVTGLVSVGERASEIGLRRALGARRDHILVQFLVESSVVGTFGGLVGCLVALGAVSVVSLARSWVVAIPVAVALVAPLVGTATGLVAGIQPAVRASRIEPVEALRR